MILNEWETQITGLWRKAGGASSILPKVIIQADADGTVVVFAWFEHNGMVFGLDHPLDATLSASIMDAVRKALAPIARDSVKVAKGDLKIGGECDAPKPDYAKDKT